MQKRKQKSWLFNKREKGRPTLDAMTALLDPLLERKTAELQYYNVVSAFERANGCRQGDGISNGSIGNNGKKNMYKMNLSLSCLVTLKQECSSMNVPLVLEFCETCKPPITRKVKGIHATRT